MKRKIDKLVVFIFMSTCLIWCSCEDESSIIGVYDHVRSTDFIAKKSFEFNVAVNSQKQLRLENVNGRVEISGSSGANVVRITGEKRVGSESLSDASAHLNDLDVKVENLADEVFVKSIHPKNSNGRNYVINYLIQLPESMALLVDNINGMITLTGIHACAVVSQVNGNIESEIAIPIDGNLNMTTVNGNINLGLPKNSSAEFSASLTNGNIRVSNLVLQNKSETFRSVRGKLGDGRGTVLVRTTNGNILVNGF